jgi:hypothetical protein
MNPIEAQYTRLGFDYAALREQYSEAVLASLAQLMFDVFPNETATRKWLGGRTVAFGGRAPRWMIENGSAEPVEGALAAWASGSHI